MGGVGIERDLKGKNLSELGKQWDMVDLAGNGVQNDPRHSTEGTGHSGSAREG